ncbi:PREDICTED: 3-hydroxy-3-methylglutaryl-coenzyme A reductase 1-like [Brassica oleracea var. oleracea]|uniref:3-hydroxy-3-methylglutaryl-coenzyme A reductase 1-like n=1 Tax=Brassica oleracea var. oleracea TaxID=109376 RepID=UPI0006A6E745|nr:PREDICTED: 3-hydroxy-3-methylglutaryl-coenzyme A reductase 1-like [Brassica oleracea var. oleracea]
MVTKGVHNVIEFLSDDSPDMDVIEIPGEFLLYVIDNFFSDNKPAAGNCIEGHGSSLGRFKSHVSNIVFDVFIATCQDPAQNMESSQIDGSH